MRLSMQKIMRPIRDTAIHFNALVLAAVMLLLAGCSGNEKMIELQNYVQRVVNRPPGAIEPLPEFTAYEAFTYSAASLRGPFDIPVDVNTQIRNQRNSEVRPDLNRPREYHENFALGALSMVGTMARGGQRWVLIKDETGLVDRLTIGNYMGRNHGRIVTISKSQLELVEIVPTGDGGWLERPQTITIQE